MPSYTKVCGGNIAPSRFVKLSTTNDGQCLQCGAGDQIYGISQPGTRNTPYSTLDDGFAGIAGENIEIFGPAGGEYKPLLEAGAAFTRGARLKADANGKGIATTADGDEYGAIAMFSAAKAGDLVEVEVVLGQRGA